MKHKTDIDAEKGCYIAEFQCIYKTGSLSFESIACEVGQPSPVFIPEERQDVEGWGKAVVAHVTSRCNGNLYRFRDEIE